MSRHNTIEVDSRGEVAGLLASFQCVSATQLSLQFPSPNSTFF
jgi:hypothetical protein